MGGSVIWLLLKINYQRILIKRSRQELSTDMVIHTGVPLKTTKLRSSPDLPSYLKQG